MQFYYVNLFILLSCLDLCFCNRYENFTLYSTIPTEQYQLNFLQNLESQKYLDVKFWKRPSKLFNEVHFLINPIDASVFEERVQHFKLNVRMLLQDVQSAFDAQKFGKYTSPKIQSFSWDSYHTLEDIYQWMSDLAQKYPQWVEVHSIGRSFEGREIYAVFIKKAKSKFDVVIDAGIHGNEWISTAFVTYLIKRLAYAEEVGDDLLNELAAKYHWYLVPVVNPDGFDYSIKTDRLWRKNRRIYKNSEGVNLDRNFPHSFGKYDASNVTKDDNYCGPEPFSEPESKALSDFIMTKRERLKFYISFHSYGQKIIIPYDDRVQHVDNFSEMDNYAKQAILRMYKIHGVKYSVGTTYDTLGLRASGSSTTWVKSTFKTKYVITFLLRDNGSYGYALPSELILPTCEETLEGLIKLMTARPRRVRANLFSAATKCDLAPVVCILILFSCFQ